MDNLISFFALWFAAFFGCLVCAVAWQCGKSLRLNVLKRPTRASQGLVTAMKTQTNRNVCTEKDRPL